MLTRSAAKKLAGSPASSVKINEEINSSCDFGKSHKVNMQCPHHEKIIDRGCSPNFNINVNINPAKVGLSRDNSGDFVRVTTNAPQLSSIAEGSSLNTSIIYNVSPSSDTDLTETICSKKSGDTYRVSDGYTNFLPTLTRSTRKRRNIQGKRASGNDSRLDKTPIFIESASKKKKWEDTSDTEKKSCQKSLFAEELNTKYNIENSKRTLIVNLVPLSKEKLRAYCSPKEYIYESTLVNSSNEVLTSSDTNNNPSDALDENKVEQKRVLEKLGSTNLNLSETEGDIKNCKNQDNCCNLGGHVDLISEEIQESICCISPEDGIQPDRLDSIRSKMVFGNTENDWNELNLFNRIKFEDSILTDTDDSEKENEKKTSGENGSLEDFYINVNIDRIVELLASPKRTEDVQEEDEIPINNNSENHNSYNSMGDVDINENAETSISVIDEESNIKIITKRVSNDGLSNEFCESGKTGQCNHIDEIWCKDKWEITQTELLQFQLKCIEKRLKCKSDEVNMSPYKSDNLNQSKMSGTNEKTSDDNILNCDSTRKTRRSKRCETMEEFVDKQGQGIETRSSIRKRIIDKMENLYETDVTTPRSTRSSTLRKETPETIKQKRRSTIKKLSALRKSGKTPKKMSEMETETEGKASEHYTEGVKDLTSSDSKISTPETSVKEDETDENESGDKEASSVSSTPKKKSSKKLSRIKMAEGKVKECGIEGTEIISSPSSGKSKSPLKAVEDKEYEERTIECVSSPLRKKKEAAERHRAEENRLEQIQMKEREVVLSQSPKKSNTPTKASQIAEKESDDVEMSVVSTPTKKNPILPQVKSPKVPQKTKIESGNTEIISSPKKNDSIFQKSPARKIEIDNMEMSVESPSKRQKIEIIESQKEFDKNIMIVSLEESKKTKLIKNEAVEMLDHSNIDDVELLEESTDQDKKDDSSGGELEIMKDEGENELEAEDVSSVLLTQEKEEELVKSLVKTAEKSVESSPKKKPKRSDTGKSDTVKDMELDKQMGKNLSVISQKESKIEECEKNNSKLTDDFLNSIPSKKAEVKGRMNMELSEKKKQRNKTKSFEISGDGYIPLNSDGPTSFSVMTMDKLKSSIPRHPAFDLKRDLLYGSRVKRIPYSQIQSYKLKEEVRKFEY